MRLFSDIGMSVQDPHLRRALSLAREGLGTTAPNPMVGCVLVRDETIVGEGYHAQAGGPHAEIVALQAAGDAARGATAYVTLEPCDHFGKTPPCSAALIEAGVERVVIGMPDTSHPSAGGADRMREAGIPVEFAEDPGPFRELNEAWLHVLRTGLPYVHVKVALSLDGHPTGAPGVRSRVSGRGGTSVTMRVRAAADAVLVGASTARIDDPALTLRSTEGDPGERQPLRVVLGTRGVPDAALFHDGLGESVALVPDGADVPRGIPVVQYDGDAGLAGALAALVRERGVCRVLVETGSRLFTAFWDAGLIDELTVVHAGGLFGPSAPALFLGKRADETENLARRMEAIEAGVMEGDAVTVWRARDAD